jgi:excisionase family DNA binding protein
MYLSVTELAKKLGVTGTRIRTLIRQGRIKGAFKVGKMWVINVLKKTMHKNNAIYDVIKETSIVYGNTAIIVKSNLVVENQSNLNYHHPKTAKMYLLKLRLESGRVNLTALKY